MSKLTLTAIAVLAGLSVTPAQAFVSGPPLNVPAEWPAEGAFSKKDAATVQDRLTVSTLGAKPKSTAPVVEENRARGR